MFKTLFLSTALLFSAAALAAPADDFVITVKTDTDGDSFTIPINSTLFFTYNYNVDCGNGEPLQTGKTGATTCHYASAGSYQIRISDNIGNKFGFPSIYFFNASASDKLKIISLDQWGSGKWTSMGRAFSGAENMHTPATDTPNLSNVAKMSFMFQGAINANPDTSNWDVGSVTNMSLMFQDAINANPDTSNWNTSKVTLMSSMFSGATNANPNTRGWDTSEVTNMGKMFFRATNANPDTSGWDTSKVKSMEVMFYQATKANPNTSGWDTGEVTNMTRMFHVATKANPNTSGWDTSKVTDMSAMFAGAVNANPDTSGWDTGMVTDMSAIFSGATRANPDTSGWNTNMMTDMSSMFYAAINANPDTSNWNTGMVTNMSSMFDDATSANPDTSGAGWNTSLVTDMSSMFRNAIHANPDLSGWDISHRPKMNNIFIGVTLSSSRYDAMLAAFAAQTIESSGDTINFHAGHSRYCNGSGDKTDLITNDNWSINDFGNLGCFDADPALNLIELSDTGLYNHDNITNDTTLTVAVSCDLVFAGAGESNEIQIFQAGGTLLHTHDCIDSGVGMANITLPVLGEGDVGLYYTVSSIFAGTSSNSSLLTVTIDTTPPPPATECSTMPPVAGPGIAVSTTCTGVETDAVITIPKMQCGDESSGEVICIGTVGAGIARISMNNDTVTISDLAGNPNTAETTGLTILPAGDCTGADGINIQDVACVIDIAKDAGAAVNGANCNELGGVDAADVSCTIDKVLAAP